MKKYEGYVLVYGGNGALGSGCVTQFKTANWWVACIALWKNIGSEVSITQIPKGIFFT